MARIGLIAQNFDIYESDGLDKFARTGATSASQIFRAGAQGVILGHSEAGDSPETINKKLKTIIAASIPLSRLVVLVGESWEEFAASKPSQVASLVARKCETVFGGIPAEFLKGLIVGYEPKWGSRGSGRDDQPPPSPEFISACISETREFFASRYGSQVKPRFIYGGRSTPERTREILADKNVDGLILGSACNSVKKTLDIARTMKEVCGNREKVLVCNFKAYDLPDSYEKYADELGKLPGEFVVLLAPPYTDIRLVRKILEEKGLLL